MLSTIWTIWVLNPVAVLILTRSNLGKSDRVKNLTWKIQRIMVFKQKLCIPQSKTTPQSLSAKKSNSIWPCFVLTAWRHPLKTQSSCHLTYDTFRLYKSLALKGAFLFSCLSCKSAIWNERATRWTLCQANCFSQGNTTLLSLEPKLRVSNLHIILGSIIAIQTLICTSNN